MLTLTLAFYSPYTYDCLDDGIYRSLVRAVAESMEVRPEDLVVEVPMFEPSRSYSQYAFVLTLSLSHQHWLHIDTRALDWEVATKTVAAAYEALAARLFQEIAPAVPFRLPWRLQVLCGEGDGTWPSDSPEQ